MGGAMLMRGRVPEVLLAGGVTRVDRASSPETSLRRARAALPIAPPARGPPSSRGPAVTAARVPAPCCGLSRGKGSEQVGIASTVPVSRRETEAQRAEADRAPGRRAHTKSGGVWARAASPHTPTPRHSRLDLFRGCPGSQESASRLVPPLLHSAHSSFILPGAHSSFCFEV